VTPVPLDLPVRPPDAAELANLVFSLAERKPLNDELRTRIAARLAPLRFESLRPHPGSLDRDPVHHSTYYMAVDGGEGQPLLLHMAPAAAPTSAIFPKPLLIGRMRSAKGSEMVLNAIPFGPRDYESLQRFASQIDEAFLPRAQGSRPAIVAPAVPGAFDGFRAVLKSSRKNVAALGAHAAQTDPADFYFAGMWAAIRAGWREGYSAGMIMAVSESLPRTIEQAAQLSHFGLDVSGLVVVAAGAEEKYGAALKAAERMHESIRQARAARKIARAFDFELRLENAAEPTSAEDLRFCLEWLKSRGHAAQVAAPRLSPESDLTALAEAATSCQCVLSVSSTAAARATGGRFQFRLAADAPDYAAYIIETASDLLP
jgi:hypothetical protein